MPLSLFYFTGEHNFSQMRFFPGLTEINRIASSNNLPERRFVASWKKLPEK